MSFTSTEKEEAFRQEIEVITEHEDLLFARKHFLFVHGHSCKEEEKPQQCIQEGRNTFVNFNQQIKLEKMRAFTCMGECAEMDCYKGCLDTLKGAVQSFYAPLTSTMDDYLLKFKD